jgi:hypothetical protein
MAATLLVLLMLLMLLMLMLLRLSGIGQNAGKRLEFLHARKAAAEARMKRLADAEEIAQGAATDQAEVKTMKAEVRRRKNDARKTMRESRKVAGLTWWQLLIWG